jgi:hypothetical protein
MNWTGVVVWAAEECFTQAFDGLPHNELAAKGEI